MLNVKLKIKRVVVKKLIIFDGNHLAYRCHYVLPQLKNDEGRSVGCIYGVLNSLFSIRKQYPGYKIAFAWDERPTKRKELFSKYKENRKEKPDWFEEFLWQLEQVKEILSHHKVDQYSAIGYEADDIAAKLVEDYKKSINRHATNRDDWECILVTSDSDWKQLVDDDNKIRLKNPIKNTIVLDEDVNTEYNINSPCQLAMIKAIRGDKSDNVPGIKRFPSKIASILAKEYKDVESLYEWLSTVNLSKKTELPKKWLKALMDNKNRILKNYKLVKLGYLIPEDIKIIKGFENLEELKLHYRKNSFKTFLGDLIKLELIRKNKNGANK